MARNTKTSKKPSVKPTTKAPVTKSVSSKVAKAAQPSVTKGGNDFQEVRTLIDLLKKNDLAVLEFEKGDFKITLKTPAGASGGGTTLIQGHAQPTAHAAPAAAPAASSSEKATAEPAKSNYKEITSPMVGTFYASPSPESPAFVEVGKTIIVDNGEIRMKVLSKTSTRVECECLTDGLMGSRRHINLPGVRVSLPALTTLVVLAGTV